MLKYNLEDIRDVLERASARETTARVAIGALTKELMAPFGISVLGYCISIGATEAKTSRESFASKNCNASLKSRRCGWPIAEAERAVIAEIDACKKTGDTLGGIVEVIATGLPVGLGSHVQWDRKLDGRLAHALLSLQAVKGVELGWGFKAARVRGSELHDEIGYDREEGRFTRLSNNSGGTEGGMSTGEPLRVRVAFKPLSTLMRPLRSVDIKSKAEARRRDRALRRMRDSGRGSYRRDGGGLRAGELLLRKVRRRFDGRNHAQLSWLSGTGA